MRARAFTTTTLVAIAFGGMVALGWGTAAAQDAQKRLVFEVASVRPAGTQGGRGSGLVGGPGSASPDRMTHTRVTIERLLRDAYGVDFDQIQGPDWLFDERYDVVANVPPGTTKEQVPIMLQHLLEDRFGLKLHHVTRDFPVYELTLGKGGARLKENVQPNLQPLRLGGSQLPTDQDGFPVLPPGTSGMPSVTMNGLTRVTAQAQPLELLLFQLRAQLGHTTSANTFAMGRVLDRTGLTGNYDFKLTYSGDMRIGGALSLPSDPSAGPSFVEALEQQLGLRLTKSMAPLDVLVIDHVDRIPTEN